MTEGGVDAERFLALVTELEAKDAQLSSVQAAIVVAAELGIAQDSRSFARKFGIAHALVLRELNALAERGDVLRITTRDERTLRTHYALFQGA